MEEDRRFPERLESNRPTLQPAATTAMLFQLSAIPFSIHFRDEQACPRHRNKRAGAFRPRPCSRQGAAGRCFDAGNERIADCLGLGNRGSGLVRVGAFHGVRGYRSNDVVVRCAVLDSGVRPSQLGIRSGIQRRVRSSRGRGTVASVTDHARRTGIPGQRNRMRAGRDPRS